MKAALALCLLAVLCAWPTLAAPDLPDPSVAEAGTNTPAVPTANTPQARRDAALFNAVAARSLPRVRALLKQGANVSACADHDRGTVLMWALEAKDPILVRLLLSRGADAHAMTKSGMTVLMAAVLMGNSDNLRLILAQNVDVHVKSKEGTALLMAADADVPENVQLLLDHGAAAGAGRADLSAAILAAAFQGNRMPHAQPVAVVKLLLDRGADVNAAAEYGGTPLISAAEFGDIALMQLLVAHGAHVNAQDLTYHNTALIEAAMEGQADAVRFLLAHGADITLRNKMFKTALEEATDAKSAPVIALLTPAPPSPPQAQP